MSGQPVRLPAPLPFRAWLNRSWIDLTQPTGSDCIIPWGIELAWQSFASDEALPRFNRLVPTGRRAKIALVARAADVTVAQVTPDEVPAHERSERWVGLCEAVARHETLPLPVRERLIWLLHRLCFHELIGSMADHAAPTGDVDVWAALLVTNTLAAASLALERGNHIFARLFEALLPSLPEGSLAAATASYHLVLEHAKFRPNAALAAGAVRTHHGLVERAAARLPSFEAGQLWSRFHRVRAFLPMLNGDLQGMVDDMDRAELFARGLAPATEAERHVAAEILWPVLESRVREAQVLGDPTLVEQRARQLVAAAPLEARAWLHLGEALTALERYDDATHVYREAHRLGPPASEIALFNLGQCYEMLDEAEPAMDAYAELLQLDPYAISAAERIAAIAAERGRYQGWAQVLLASLEGLRTTAHAT